jgi:hypothetical protein
MASHSTISCFFNSAYMFHIVISVFKCWFFIQAKDCVAVLAEECYKDFNHWKKTSTLFNFQKLQHRVYGGNSVLHALNGINAVVNIDS